MNKELKRINIEIAVAQHADFKNLYGFEFWAGDDYSRKEIYDFLLGSKNEDEDGVTKIEDDSTLLIYQGAFLTEANDCVLKDEFFYYAAAKDLLRFLTINFQGCEMIFMDYTLRIA